MSIGILKVASLTLALGAATLGSVGIAYAAPKSQPVISAAEKAWMDRVSQQGDGF